MRARKLLMHRREIDRLSGKVKEQGLTLIPLRLYFKHGHAKVEIGVARGKKLYDKRESIKEREVRREMDRARSASECRSVHKIGRCSGTVSGTR